MKALYRRGYVLTAALAVLLGGCATTQGARTGSDPDLLTRDQIMGVTGVTSLYDVIQRLRPRWLTVRAGDRSFGMNTEIAVFEDQTYLGNTDTLRQLQPGMAFQLKWMNGNQASDALAGVPQGTHLAGAIIVSTHPPQGGE